MLKFYNTITKASAFLMFNIIILSGSSNRFSSIYQISPVEDFARKRTRQCLFSANLVTLNKSQTYLKDYNETETGGAFNHGKCEQGDWNISM